MVNMWGKILALFIIIGMIFYLGLAYEHSLMCSLLGNISPSVTNFFQCGYVIPTGTSSGGYVGDNTLNTNATEIYEIQPYVSNITKVQPGIKDWKSFANYTTNQTSQLNALNVFTGYASDEYLYYKPENVYAPYSFNIIVHYYDNGTFSNYNPSLVGKVVNISFSSRNTKPGYNLQYVITNITIGKIFGENKMVTWYLRENFGNASGLVNVTNIILNGDMNKTVLSPMGLYFQNGTEIVLPYID